MPADVALLGAAVEFLRLYADKLHHSKEEKLFFPLLVKRGVPAQGCPIGGLTHEHEKGRLLVQALSEQTPAIAQGSPGAKDALLQTLRDLVDLYQNHIWKEDAMVFPMADKVLTAADQEELSKHFAEVDRSIGLESVTRMEQLAKSLPQVPQAKPPEPAPRSRATVAVVARHETGSSRANPDGETIPTRVAPMDPMCEIGCTRTRMRRRPSP